MKSDWTILFLGILSAVVAAIVVEWINRAFNAPTYSANDVAWRQVLAGGNECSPCVLPNFNRNPDSPAYTYQTGAPVTNYRAFQRVGVLEVPVG
jgi:hypothetical protein